MLIVNLLRELIDGSGSDLHLVSGSRPRIRINGELKDAECETAVVGHDDVWKMFEPLLSQTKKAALENRQDINSSIAWNDSFINARFRICLFWDRCGLSAALRLIPTKIPLLSDLFPPELEATFRSFINRRRGLILVVGATGSGKSTTVAAMIDAINIERSERIFTIEEPIEYGHTSKMSLISQREVGSDVESYEQGGLSVMRADPDVILIGELMTPEAVRIALAAAETGHLVFSTIHADSVSEAVRRLVESFPDNKETMQSMLARSLVTVVTQRLLPRASNTGRVAVHEIMIANSTIRKLIDEGQTDLSLAIEAGRNEGMCTMDDSVLGLYREGAISYDTAWNRVKDRERLGPRPVIVE